MTLLLTDTINLPYKLHNEFDSLVDDIECDYQIQLAYAHNTKLYIIRNEIEDKIDDTN